MLRDGLHGLAVHGCRCPLINLAVATEDVEHPGLTGKPCQHASLDRGVVRNDKALIVVRRRDAVTQDACQSVVRAVAAPKLKLGLRAHHVAF